MFSRCGALHVGDQILTIDGSPLDDVSVTEATQMLRGSHGNSVRLEIIPVTSASRHRNLLTDPTTKGTKNNTRKTIREKIILIIIIIIIKDRIF